MLLEIIARDGLDEEGWRRLLKDRADIDPAGLEPDAAERVAFTRLNLHRTLRLERTWQPTSALAARLMRLAVPQTWLVISEPWCGDSAQCLPCLVVAARLSPLVRLRVLTRDDHPEVMDRYLTHGTRSIPILVGLDGDGRERFRWGPRPAAAQAVVDAAKAEGLDKATLLEKLHLFYGRDRGRALDAELAAVLDTAFGSGAP
ncbi:MAG: thioredoxin family protein [bacterium]|nr:thioredoxin family protein [bacterium]